MHNKFVMLLHYQRLALARALIGDFSSHRRIGHPTTGEMANLRRLNTSLKHFPKKGKGKRRCFVCSKHGEMHGSRVVCRVCEVYLYDALSDCECFYKYHSFARFLLSMCEFLVAPLAVL